MRSRQQIQEIQLALLRKQLVYCEQNVEYYSKLFADIDFRPAELRDLTQLERLPLLDKPLARRQHEALRGKKYQTEKVRKSFSSGSTGEPFATYFDTLSWYRKKYLTKLRARFACGMKAGERVAILECESEEVVAARNTNTFLADRLLKVRVFSMFQPAEALLARLNEFAPHNIYAYPSHLLELSQSNKGTQPLIPELRRLFTSSEFLEQGSRTHIEQRFGAELFDHYGSTEFKEIAWECPQHGWYHINYEEVICEVINDSGPCLNEPGEIVVTDLRNRAMPLIRFKIGDLGIMSNTPCGCGYSGDSMKPLGGRASDYFTFPDKITVSPFRITTAVEDVSGLLQYQIVQRASDEVTIFAVWDSTADQGQAQLIEATMHEVLRSAGVVKGVKVSVISVDTIDNEENGKFRVVKSEINE